VQGVLELWVLSLRAYTVALKNLEGIQGTKKEEHLLAVLEGWGTLLRYACLLFETLLVEREFPVGHLRFRLRFPEKIPNHYARILFVSLPLLVSQILRQDLGSQKLAAQLKNEALANSPTTAFLQTGLYADMKLDHYIGQLKRLHDKLRDSPFFLEAMLVKLRDIYLRYDIGRDEQKGFRALVADVSADAKGLRGRDRLEHIGKFLSDLSKSEVVAKLRDDHRGSPIR
jgi:hypothetical protein